MVAVSESGPARMRSAPWQAVAVSVSTCTARHMGMTLVRVIDVVECVVWTGVVLAYGHVGT